MHIGLGRQLQEARSILGEENAYETINCSPPCGQELPDENFREAGLLSGLGYKSAHSQKISLFTCRTCEYGGTKSKEWCQCYGNVYFHLTMSFVQKHNKKMTFEDVTIAMDTFTLLIPDHLHFLHQKTSLEIIVAKLK